jgi:hypothetical protein
MNKKSWAVTITALIAAAILGICGVVYYGTFVQPGERIAADKAACDAFAVGITEARNGVMKIAAQTPTATDQQEADTYLTSFDKGLTKAFDLASKKGDVYQSLTQLSLTRISYDSSMGMNAISALEGQFANLQASCSVVEPAATATPSN